MAKAKKTTVKSKSTNRKALKKPATKSAAKTKTQAVKKISFAAKVVSAARGAIGLSDSNDLVEILLQDHKPLKDLIKKMKDSKLKAKDREAAFAEFAPLLLTHSRPEEKTLYTSMKTVDMREDAFEGDVEHALADQLVEEIKRTDDSDLRSARIKVLAELVEHHIKEEEEDMLPEFRRSVEEATRVELGKKFLDFKRDLQADGSDDAPPEAELRETGMINKPIHA